MSRLEAAAERRAAIDKEWELACASEKAEMAETALRYDARITAEEAEQNRRHNDPDAIRKMHLGWLG